MLREQRRQLELAEQHTMSLNQRLHELRTNSSPNLSAEQLLRMTTDEHSKTRDTLERLKQELIERERRLDQAEVALSEPPVTEGDVRALEQELRELKGEVDALQKKADQTANAQDDKLSIYRQQASMVAKRKENLVKDLKKLEEERAQLEVEFAQRERELESVKGPKYLKGEEFKKYATSLRGKTNTFKRMKAELAEFKSERIVLSRTETILKSRATNLDEYVKGLEKKKGVAGYEDTQSELEKVSATNTQLNEEKEKTLEEYSRIVTDIQNQLKEKKNHLAPQIKELRLVRTRFQEMEQVYNEKKQTYESIAVGIESEKSKLEAEVASLADDVQKEESRYHILQATCSLLDAQLQRVQDEIKFLNGEKQLSKEHRSHTDQYNHRLNILEGVSKELRKQQKNIKENHEPNLKQVKMFQQLEQLLRAKLASCKQLDRTGGNSNDMEGMSMNRLVLRE
eukprot:GILI01013478.1.p1 GENE.GILI01013478.1~~GILI01013478.1.p1  ORF type:complete len:484 (-),score=209.06 GILI01013478.1:89-1456(-)